MLTYKAQCTLFISLSSLRLTGIFNPLLPIPINMNRYSLTPLLPIFSQSPSPRPYYLVITPASSSHSLYLHRHLHLQLHSPTLTLFICGFPYTDRRVDHSYIIRHHPHSHPHSSLFCYHIVRTCLEPRSPSAFPHLTLSSFSPSRHNAHCCLLFKVKVHRTTL